MIPLASQVLRVESMRCKASVFEKALNKVRLMNAGGDSVRGKHGQAVQQTTITLPYFDEEIPLLCLPDGTAYLPVRPLCRMFGLRAETHIPRWRKLVFWSSARKLPLQTVRGKCIVWCLHLGVLPFWSACFNWSLVSAERREQLRRATDAWQEDVAQAQRLLLERYRSLRRGLFAFLEAYSDAEARFDQWALQVSSSLNVIACRQLELLLLQGKTLVSEATAQARKMIQEHSMAPVMDIVTIDARGEGTEIGTLPLFPVIPQEDREQFLASLRKLTEWYLTMAAFIDQLKSSRTSDQSKEV